jgi:nitrate reductase assembly molybdenum cofactor insertion protein NarJ
MSSLRPPDDDCREQKCAYTCHKERTQDQNKLDLTRQHKEAKKYPNDQDSQEYVDCFDHDHKGALGRLPAEPAYCAFANRQSAIENRQFFC